MMEKFTRLSVPNCLFFFVLSMLMHFSTFFINFLKKFVLIILKITKKTTKLISSIYILFNITNVILFIVFGLLICLLAFFLIKVLSSFINTYFVLSLISKQLKDHSNKYIREN